MPTRIDQEELCRRCKEQVAKTVNSWSNRKSEIYSMIREVLEQQIRDDTREAISSSGVRKIIREQLTYFTDERLREITADSVEREIGILVQGKLGFMKNHLRDKVSVAIDEATRAWIRSEAGR